MQIVARFDEYQILTDLMSTNRSDASFSSLFPSVYKLFPHCCFLLSLHNLFETVPACFLLCPLTDFTPISLLSLITSFCSHPSLIFKAIKYSFENLHFRLFLPTFSSVALDLLQSNTHFYSFSSSIPLLI